MARERTSIRKRNLPGYGGNPKRNHGSIIQDHSLNQPTPSEGTAVFATSRSQTPVTTAATIQEMEKNALVEALKIAGGNVEQVAKSLGISRATCYRKIKKYQIE